LVKLLRGIPSKINLIPLNEAPGIPFKKPSDEKVREFQEILLKGGFTAIVRASKGADISAACGQLHAESSEFIGNARLPDGQADLRSVQGSEQ
jgi:23S rRNA (adenine2503-C2)-methyltransferase